MSPLSAQRHPMTLRSGFLDHGLEQGYAEERAARSVPAPAPALPRDVDVPDSAAELVAHMLDADPTRRPRASEVAQGLRDASANVAKKVR